MKKFFITLSLVAVSLSMASCEYLKKLEEKAAKGEVAEVNGHNEGAVAPVTNPNEVRVYSNAYDGFVNVRSQPSAKSAILGRLKNGPDYLVQLGVQGKWIIVQWQNGIGYVNKSVVGYTPWKPVYLSVDGDWIQGVYQGGEPYFREFVDDLWIFSNGKFAYVDNGGGTGEPLAYGTWKFEGKEIVLTTKLVVDDWFEGVAKEQRLVVDVPNRTVGGKPKVQPANYNKFVAEKKQVNKLVSLK